MAQGVAWMARELGVEPRSSFPTTPPGRSSRRSLGSAAARSPCPFDAWWEAMETGVFPGLDGHFVHPVRDPAVMAGNGTIGLELVEQLDGIDAVLIPWGGGGLTTGIASALAAVSPSDEGLRLRAGDGQPRCPPRSRPASRSRCPTRPRSSTVPARRGCYRTCGRRRGRCSREHSPCRSRDAAAAVRLLAERLHVIAEGAGALALAAALTGGRRQRPRGLHRVGREHRRRRARRRSSPDSVPD